MRLDIDPHPGLRLDAFVARLPSSLAELPSPDWLTSLLSDEVDTPVTRNDEIRTNVRDLLRHGGYKPTGRGKPASEYLVRAAREGKLGSINAVVDLCNVVSLHSGLPISVVDLDLAEPPFRAGLADPGTSYVFNPSGQEIRLDGLLCLHDARGPCANAVKDSQRTKTRAETRSVLCVLWGITSHEETTRGAGLWYRELTRRLGGEVEDVPGRSGGVAE